MTAFRPLAAAAAALALYTAAPVLAQEKTEFRVAWSIYVGWMPWGYLEDSGIMDKWAEKYGIDIEIVQINDYVESINQYTAGAFDGVSATNMDTLSIPSGGGVDTGAARWGCPCAWSPSRAACARLASASRAACARLASENSSLSV